MCTKDEAALPTKLRKKTCVKLRLLCAAYALGSIPRTPCTCCPKSSMLSATDGHRAESSLQRLGKLVECWPPAAHPCWRLPGQVTDGSRCVAAAAAQPQLLLFFAAALKRLCSNAMAAAAALKPPLSSCHWAAGAGPPLLRATGPPPPGARRAGRSTPAS